LTGIRMSTLLLSRLCAKCRYTPRPKWRAVRADLSRRRTELRSELPVEPRQIAEAGFQRHIADAQMFEARADKHSVSAHQPLFANEFRKTCPVLRKQPLHVAPAPATANGIVYVGIGNNAAPIKPWLCGRMARTSPRCGQPILIVAPFRPHLPLRMALSMSALEPMATSSPSMPRPEIRFGQGSPMEASILLPPLFPMARSSSVAISVCSPLRSMAGRTRCTDFRLKFSRQPEKGYATDVMSRSLL
jgi:hypothetical protein